MRGWGKSLILVGLALSVLAAFGWLIATESPAPPTIRPARTAAPAVPRPELSTPAGPPETIAAPASPANPPPASPARPTESMVTSRPIPAATGAVADFQAWTREALKPGAKPGDFFVRGEALAKSRRAALEELIVQDPERAIASAVSPLVRQQLPAAVAAQLEDRVSTRGEFRVLGTLPPENSAAVLPAVSRQVVAADGTTYEAYVYGKRSRQLTSSNVALSGVAINGKLAVAESAVRQVEAGEKIPADTPVVEVCPISGQTVPGANTGEVPADASALEIGGTIHFLCGANHLAEVQQAIESGKLSVPGVESGPPPVTTDSSYNQGIKKILIIRCNFTDATADFISVASAQSLLAATDAFMNENSYGTCRIDLVNSYVTPVSVTMPKTKAQYASENNSIGFLADARAAATAAGYNYLNYDFEWVMYAGIYGFSGQAYVGGRGVWLQSGSTGVACHEWGHNLGLWHANAWSAPNDTIIGSGSNVEYGNSFDTMGAASAGKNSFNACHRNILGWLPNDNVQAATTSGTYRVFAFDQTTLNPGQVLALHTTKDSTREYWLEHRVQWGSTVSAANGLLVNWSPWGSSNGGSQLLDMSPGTGGGVGDGGLIIGRTFSDPLAGVHITPIAKNATSPESIDVVINRGAFPGNRPPTLSLGSSATTVATNTPVNFTASASDPDGDPLAYYWDFGNGTAGPNLPSATAQWSSAGYYNVICTVSDMKGKTVTRTKLITVGTPATFTASGTVTDNFGQVMSGVRVHNGLTGGNYRGTYTDSSGNYTLVNLAAGSYTLAAVSAAYSSAAPANFTNPITVGPNQSNLNFTGTSLGAFVNVAAPAASAREAGQVPASFTFTRGQEVPATGPQTINFTLSGTADKAADYAVAAGAPATGTYNSATGAGTLTFPAGALTATLKITPVDDATNEGTETVVATLNAGTGYQLGGSVTAVGYITDNDATDTYTESFSSSTSTPYPFDLDGRKVTFTPLTSTTYQGNTDPVSSLPTDPTGGTVLANNGAAVVAVTSGSVQFGYWQLTGLSVQPKVFGTTYSQIFINTAGNISFEFGDTSGDSVPSQHFINGRKRVSLCGNYMDLTKGGTVSYKIITTPGAQRIVVTYANVPRYYSPATLLNGQIELWANGTITLTWLGTTINDGVAGLAAGQSVPSPFYASDLSAYPPTPTTYAMWAAGKFNPTELGDPNISGALMDPDKDGWSNLFEYALGSDPHSISRPPGAPVVTNVGGYLTITFQRNPVLTDVSYVVEASTLSGGWTAIAQSMLGSVTAKAAGQTPSSLTETPTGNVVTVTVGDTVPISGASQRFLRLRVTKP